MARPKKPSVKQESFLKAFAKCGIVSTAARRARVGAGMHFRWMQNDPSYAARFEDARQRAIEHLEELLLKQAEEGNTTALIFALKSNWPEKYRENFQRVELTGRNGGAIETRVETVPQSEIDRVKAMTDEELYAQIACIEMKRSDDGDVVDEQPALVESNGSGHLRIAGPEG